MAEQVVAAGRAGDTAEGVVGEAQVFRQQFAVAGTMQLGKGVAVVLRSLFEGAQMAFACDVGGFFAFVTTDGGSNGVAQGVDTVAGFCR